MNADERLVADELARLDVYDMQQPRAEAALLRMLPVAEAAAILRERMLADLSAPAGDGPRGWEPYLQLEAAVLRMRGLPHDRPYHDRLYHGSALWRDLGIGPEPEGLAWTRRQAFRPVNTWLSP